MSAKSWVAAGFAFALGTVSTTAHAAETWRAASKERGHPRLVIAPGPLLGPHSIGAEECRSSESECETNGSFFGTGVQVEVRPRIYKVLYLHARPFIVGNAAPNKVYSGAWGVGAGFGAYGQHIFGRAEYVFVDAFGSDRFRPPFFTEDVGRDQWGFHAGLLSVGFRLQVKGRVGLELWGGPMFGPRSVRTIPGMDDEKRTLITFMLGFNVSVDVVKAR